MFSWLTIELAGHHIAWQGLATWVFARHGALSAWPGWVGLALASSSWIGLGVLLVQGSRARYSVAHALNGYATLDLEHSVPRHRLLLPIPWRRTRFRRVLDVVYGHASGRKLTLDIYLPPAERRGLCPAVVQLHGGAWIIGDKREQGIPLLMHLSDHGWIGFNVNYRLSPGATFPDHLVDVKRAIAWIREHAEEYGVDRRFIAVTGGSAGGHLAAMAALTGNDPRYQINFPHADTSVQACAPIYGVYDLANRLGGHSPHYVDRFIGPVVIKAFYSEEPHKFHDASPVDQVNEGAPPFFVIHGDRDTMSPLEDAKLFVDRLRACSSQPVLFACIPGAQHAFDVFLSPRSAPVIEGVHAFLSEARTKALRAEVALATTTADETSNDISVASGDARRR